MKGGFWDSLTQGFSSAWEKTKNAASSATSGLTGSTSTSSSYTPPSYTPPPPNTSAQPMTTSTYGGRTKRRRMRGGFKDNTSTSGLAAHAASFSGQTAQPHNLVGGRTRRRGRKSRRNRRR
jgi:hypothetical protein